MRIFYKYPYGVFYDADVKDAANAIRTSDGIIIYTNIAAEQWRTVHSLEGVFETFEEFNVTSNNPVCLRREMQQFEQLHQGRFVPFSSKRVRESGE